MVIRVVCAGNPTTGPTYNMDDGPLSITASGIRIGQKGTECGGGHDYTIRSYGDQVDEYRIWLAQQVKDENIPVMIALDDIYGFSQEPEGITLITKCIPDPWVTHAHACEQFIREMANG